MLYLNLSVDFLGYTYFLNSRREAFLQISTNHLKKMSTWQVFKEVILFYFKQKKQLAFFIAKVVESRSHWKEFDPECRLDQVLKSSSHNNLISSYVEAELISEDNSEMLLRANQKTTS